MTKRRLLESLTLTAIFLVIGAVIMLAIWSAAMWRWLAVVYLVITLFGISYAMMGD